MSSGTPITDRPVQRHARGRARRGELRRVEHVEATQATEGEAAVRESVIGVERELIALQAMLAAEAACFARGWSEASETGVAGQPEVAASVDENAVDRFEYALVATEVLEAQGAGPCRIAVHPRETAAFGADPHRA